MLSLLAGESGDGSFLTTENFIPPPSPLSPRSSVFRYRWLTFFLWPVLIWRILERVLRFIMACPSDDKAWSLTFLGMDSSFFAKSVTPAMGWLSSSPPIFTYIASMLFWPSSDIAPPFMWNGDSSLFSAMALKMTSPATECWIGWALSS